MFTNFLSLLALGAINFATTHAQGRGDATAVNACIGFKAGDMICLTDVSFVICRGGGGFEVEQFVAPGTWCEKGIPYQRKDAIVAGAATTTRMYDLYAPATQSTLAPIVSSPPPASSQLTSSSLATSPSPASSPPASSAPLASSAPPDSSVPASSVPPASSAPPASPATSNSVVPFTSATTFATSSAT